MGAGKQRWWDINGDRVRHNIALYEQRVEAARAGFVPATVRVHGIRFTVAAGIEVRQVPKAPSLANLQTGVPYEHERDATVVTDRWVPAWCEALAESTWRWGNADWRGTMLREANDDPEVRNALLAALRIGGPEALAARYGDDVGDFDDRDPGAADTAVSDGPMTQRGAGRNARPGDPFSIARL